MAGVHIRELYLWVEKALCLRGLLCLAAKEWCRQTIGKDILWEYLWTLYDNVSVYL